MKDSDASRALKEARSFVKAREYSSALEKYIGFTITLWSTIPQ